MANHFDYTEVVRMQVSGALLGALCITGLFPGKSPQRVWPVKRRGGQNVHRVCVIHSGLALVGPQNIAGRTYYPETSAVVR